MSFNSFSRAFRILPKAAHLLPRRNQFPELKKKSAIGLTAINQLAAAKRNHGGL